MQVVTVSHHQEMFSLLFMDIRLENSPFHWLFGGSELNFVPTVPLVYPTTLGQTKYTATTMEPGEIIDRATKVYRTLLLFLLTLPHVYLIF